VLRRERSPFESTRPAAALPFPGSHGFGPCGPHHALPARRMAGACPSRQSDWRALAVGGRRPRATSGRSLVRSATDRRHRARAEARSVASTAGGWGGERRTTPTDGFPGGLEGRTRSTRPGRRKHASEASARSEARAVERVRASGAVTPESGTPSEPAAVTPESGTPSEPAAVTPEPGTPSEGSITVEDRRLPPENRFSMKIPHIIELSAEVTDR
jgi:hypothetical protein